MKNLAHKITSDIQFLYACIAYEDSSTDKELIVKSETRLSKIYPVKKSVKGMKSVGGDYWGRETFIDEHEQYYCELDGKLYFKGNDQDGEPHYPVKETIEYENPNFDNVLVEFNPLIDKVKEYAQKESGIKLVESTPYFQLDEEDISNSKIICTYKFELEE